MDWANCMFLICGVMLGIIIGMVIVHQKVLRLKVGILKARQDIMCHEMFTDNDVDLIDVAFELTQLDD